MQGINIVGVQFRRAGKIYDFSAGETELSIGDHVVVDSERGASIAQVVAIRFHNPKLKLDKKLKPILRRATKKDLNKDSHISPEDVTSFTNEQVAKHELKMKVLKSDVQFGGSKVVVYFTSPGRVDFRGLVKDLASGLKTRVELKQVGARDETKLIGGIGICGREYCCSSFLREFAPVSIRMAKNQNLALNPNKVSGGCGRLLCCLTYENEAYTHLRQVLPNRGTMVEIKSQGVRGKVIKGDLLNQVIVVEVAKGDEITCKVSDAIIINQQAKAIQTEEPDQLDLDADAWAQNLDLDQLSEHLDQPKQKFEGKKQRPNNTNKKKPFNKQRPNRHDSSANEGRAQAPRNDKEAPNHPKKTKGQDRNQGSGHRRPKNRKPAQQTKAGENGHGPAQNQEKNNPAKKPKKRNFQGKNKPRRPSPNN